MSLRDWVYLLSLLIPFVVYNLALNACEIALHPGAHRLAPALDLMWSDVFFNLGYALLWIGLFATVRSKPLHLVVTFLFHVVTTLVVIATTVAYLYLLRYGTTLDYRTIAEWIPRFEKIQSALVYDVPTSAWMLLAAALFYTSLGPMIVTRVVERRRSPEDGGFSTIPAETSVLGSLGLWFVALGFGLLSLQTDTTTDAIVPFADVIATDVQEVTTEDDVREAGQPTEPPATHARLAGTPRTEKRNVVLIHLESTRAQSVTPYNEDLKTTPFLDELAKSSLLAERAYTTVPHTSKASVSANCGVYPHLVTTTTEALPEGIPAPCLAGLLKQQGYNTVFFQSSTKSFENFQGLVRHFGYEEYYPLEAMSEEGFEKTNYFGYEDDIMLEPSEEWLEAHGDEPFVAEYLTGTGHHDYQCTNTSHGTEDFAEDELINSYLNCMRLQDIFLKDLFDQYKRLGLYENTIFVIFGDHGEGFGEHGLLGHNDTIYEEGTKVPLLIHAPGYFGGGGRVEELSNHTDVLPTVLDMLGYEVENGEYPGYSLLHPIPEDRTLFISCFFEDT